jgi:hypothetical protein
MTACKARHLRPDADWWASPRCQSIGVLLEIETGPVHCAGERGLSALPGPDQRNGWKIGKPPPEKGFDLPIDVSIASRKLIVAGPV